MSAEAAVKPIHVLLVDDHVAFRQTLALAFSLEPNLMVVGVAGSLAEGRRLLPGTERVDVALLDIDLPDGDGTALIPELQKVNKVIEVLVLTASVARIDLAHAVEAGAAGLLHKSTPLEEIVDAVNRVAAGESLLTRRELIEFLRLAGRQRESDRAAEEVLANLTSREREVLLVLAEGLSDRAIAERLRISSDTVHSHMVHLLSKLGVESRLQALLFAIKSGLVSLE